MTSAGYAGRGAERIGTVAMLTDAFQRVRQHLRAFAVFTAVAGALNFGLEFGTQALGVNTSDNINTPGDYAYVAANCLLAGVTGAAALRVLLGGALRPDRGLVVGMLLLAAMQGAVWGPMMLLGAAPAPPTDMASLLGLVFLILGGAFAVFVVLVRLTLWPIGPIAGRPEVTAAASWRLMRGATRGYILAILVLVIPVAGVVIGGLRLIGQDYFSSGPPTLASIVLAALSGAAFLFVTSAVAVAIFARRVLAPSSLADVFA
jgi:hypothetical protein